MTFDYLIDQYGTSYILNSVNRRQVISDRLIDACQDLLSRDLNAGGKTFRFAGQHDFSEFKSKLKSHFEDKDVVATASELAYIFQGRGKTVEQLTYEVIPEEFAGILIEKVVAISAGNKSLYNELTSFESPTFSRPIYSSSDDNQVTLNFEKVANKCRDQIKDFQINVFGKKVVGEDVEEEILLHGNQVLATETSPEGITYNVEKSGDLPKDAATREKIMADRIQDLDNLITDDVIIRYEIEELSDRTVIKTYFRVFEDYDKTFNVSNIL